MFLFAVSTVVEAQCICLLHKPASYTNNRCPFRQSKSPPSHQCRTSSRVATRHVPQHAHTKTCPSAVVLGTLILQKSALELYILKHGGSFIAERLQIRTQSSLHLRIGRPSEPSDGFEKALFSQRNSVSIEKRVTPALRRKELAHFATEHMCESLFSYLDCVKWRPAAAGSFGSCAPVAGYGLQCWC